MSARSACSLLQFPHLNYYCQSRRDPQVALRMHLKELAASPSRFGYRRLHLPHRREGWRINHKLAHRLYCEEGLQVRTCRRRKVAMQSRLSLDQASRVDERWSMGFVTDQLLDGRHFRVFTVVDQFSRKCVALHVGISIRSKDVGAVLDAATRRRGAPAAINCGNGSESTSRFFDAWAYSREIELDFIRPGKPVENAFIESFNGRFRDECLSQTWFTDIDDAQAAIGAWDRDYNGSQPHTSLGGRAPREHVAQLLAAGALKEAVLTGILSQPLVQRWGRPQPVDSRQPG